MFLGDTQEPGMAKAQMMEVERSRRGLHWGAGRPRVLRTLAFTLSDLDFLEDFPGQAYLGRRDGNRLGNKGRTQRSLGRPLQQGRKEDDGADQDGPRE